MSISMKVSAAWVLPLMISVFGSVALAIPYLIPTSQDKVTALVFPPTTARAEVLQDVAGLGLPIRNIGWNGRLVELDLSDLPQDQRTGLRHRLSSLALQIAVRPTPLCVVPFVQGNAK